MPPVLYLIDGHALAYRMYFALTAGGSSTRWQNSKGEPTAGIYGFARELLRILEQERPEYLAVAFDTGKTFRHEIFPEYKATRAKMPDDLRPQIERIREMVDAFNIPRLEMEGYEADDVLGSIAHIAAEQGMGVKIITGDRDLLQLVNARTAVYLAGDDATFITEQDVERKLGVRPDQVVDYKAIVGDKSDNIPGVPGVGEKTAVALLKKYETLDGIYGHLDEVEKRWKTKLEAGKDSAYKSYDLARIRTDLQLKLDLEQARSHVFDAARIEAFFEQMEFRTLIRTLDKLTGSEEPTPSGRRSNSAQMSMFVNQPVAIAVTQPESTLDVTIVDTAEKLEALRNGLAAAQVISFDTETTSTDEMQADIVGISLAIKAGEGYYIPLGHLAGQNLPLEQVIRRAAGTDDRSEDPQNRAQRQVRLHHPGTPRTERDAARPGYHDRRVRGEPQFASPGTQDAGLRALGRRDDPHRAAHRHRETPDQHGGGRDRGGLRLRGSRRRDHPPAHAPDAGRT